MEVFMQNVSIEKVSKKNWKKACSVEIKPEQEHFLASVAYCLARAYVNPYEDPIEPFVIYADTDIVGFFWVTFVDNKANCILCGFRIDKKYQGFGFSKMALNEIVGLLKREYPECNSIQLFVETTNIPARNLYKGFGFETVHINSDSDLELMLYKIKDNVIVKIISEESLNDE
jgi:diamine N-acetyltransferase